MDIKLPDAELDVLKTLWRLGPSTAKTIREETKPPRNHATISTLLRRLESKNYVRRSKTDEGREFVYEAIAKPDKTRQSLVKNFLQQTFDGSGIEMVNALFQSKAPSAEEIDELQQLLDEMKKSKRGKSK